MSREIHEGKDWGQFGHYADQVETSITPTHSKLLDASGNPMRYHRPKVGFDLGRAIHTSKEPKA